MQPADLQRALRALRAVYAIVREPHRDEVAAAVADFGVRLGRAASAGDTHAAERILADVGEWLVRMRHVITSRLEAPFTAGAVALPVDPPVGRRQPHRPATAARTPRADRPRR
ncbi:MAG: hypothetical protein D6689_19600 [Deltaproteobacteria bacterium]|nr:MAG: hypothetical protein D6689_19600 [Deltaproteobacteria bacterium]